MRIQQNIANTQNTYLSIVGMIAGGGPLGGGGKPGGGTVMGNPLRERRRI